MSKSYSIVVLKLNEFQRKVLKKSAVLEIDNPPAEILDYVSSVLKKAGDNPITVLARLMHASIRTMTTFTEFKYDKDELDADGNVQQGTSSIVTHIFEIAYPTPKDDLQMSSFKDKVVITGVTDTKVVKSKNRRRKEKKEG